MITDRRRYGAAWPVQLVARVAAAARAGIQLVQVRERDLEGGALLALVRDCLAAVHGTATRVLVNDRTDVALAAGAHGVHLPGDAVAAAAVRAITPSPFLIGRSVHALDEAQRVATAGGVDYLMFGTVFESSSKAGFAAAGTGALATIAASVPVPVLAVGGVTADRIIAIRESGAAGAAAIGLFADSSSFDTLVSAL